jgi:hypothetical protein
MKQGLAYWVIGTAIFTSLLLTGCSRKAEEDLLNDEEVISDPSLLDDDLTELVPLPPSVGSVDDNRGFDVSFVNDNEPPLDYKIHREISPSNNWDTACTIMQDQVGTSDADIICTLDAEELDLAFEGVNFDVNVPSNMCHYFSFKPYYYFGLDVGKPQSLGPVVMLPTPAPAASPTPNPQARPRYTASETTGFATIGPVAVEYDINLAGDVTNFYPSPAGSAFLNDSNKARCRYDRSSDGGPNCCYGDYLEITNREIEVPDESTPDPTDTIIVVDRSVKNLEWGGKPGNCLEGAGNDFLKSRNRETNFPIFDIYNVQGVGLNTQYELKSSNFVRSQSLYYANYSSPADHAGPVPEAMARVSVFSPGSETYRPYYYKFECYDENEELEARIRVQIREWNTKPEFHNQDTSVTAGVAGHDKVGIEPGFGGDFQINDRYDWKDKGDNFPGLIIEY